MKKTSYSVAALIPHILFIAILIGIYYFIWKNNLFYNQAHIIYPTIKILIALDIFIAAAGSTLASILTLTAGLSLLYFEQMYAFSISSTGWQLIILSGIGFITRFLVR